MARVKASLTSYRGGITSGVGQSRLLSCGDGARHTGKVQSRRGALGSGECSEYADEESFREHSVGLLTAW